MPAREWYQDLEFPGYNPPRTPSRHTPAWRSVHDAYPGAPLFTRVDPTDVDQGGRGPKGLVGAMCLLAENPDLVRAMFVQDSLTPNGQYDVKLWDFVKQETVVVNIDSFVPCLECNEPNTAPSAKLYPSLTAPSGNEVWAPLLEKAVAKFRGGYENLHMLTCLDALLILCKATVGEGGEVLPDIFRYSADGKLWSASAMGVEASEQGARKLVVASNMSCSADGLWDKLKKHLFQRHQVVASTQPIVESVESLGGLEIDAPYTIVNVYEDAGVRLLQLRNPGGRSDWRGPWSSGSECWKGAPAVDLDTTFYHSDGSRRTRDEGLFWLPLSEFLAHFCKVEVFGLSLTDSQRKDIARDGVLTPFLWAPRRGVDRDRHGLLEGRELLNMIRAATRYTPITSRQGSPTMEDSSLPEGMPAQLRVLIHGRKLSRTFEHGSIVSPSMQGANVPPSEVVNRISAMAPSNEETPKLDDISVKDMREKKESEKFTEAAVVQTDETKDKEQGGDVASDSGDSNATFVDLSKECGGEKGGDLLTDEEESPNKFKSVEMLSLLDVKVKVKEDSPDQQSMSSSKPRRLSADMKNRSVDTFITPVIDVDVSNDEDSPELHQHNGFLAMVKGAQCQKCVIS